MHNLGQTRSANRRDHLLHTPDTFIRTPLPGLTNGLAIVHIAPPTGAAFTMMTLEIAPHGKLIQGPTQRFLYVLEGKLKLRRARQANAPQPRPPAATPTSPPATRTPSPPSRPPA